MDSNTNVAFIPKTPLNVTEQRSRPVSLFFIAAFLILFASVGVAFGLWIYKQTLTKTLASSDAEVAALFNDYKESVQNQDVVKKAEQLGIELGAVRGLIDNHISLSPLFQFIEEHTIKDVQFTSFEFNKDEKGVPVVKMEALARSYMAAALQREEFKRCSESFQDPKTPGSCGTPGDLFVLNSFTVSTPKLNDDSSVEVTFTLELKKDALLYRHITSATTPMIESTTIAPTPAP